MITRAAIVAAVLALSAAPAAAKDKDKDGPAKLPTVYKTVVDCKTVAEGVARLACYDAAVAAMDAAQRGNDLVVTDRAAIREARRGLFGLSLPKLRLFGDGADDEVKEITGTVTGVRSGNDGMDVFTLADGARWKQTDGGITYAKSGDPIRIRRTALGGYMANIKGGVAVRVIRLAN